MTQLALLDIFVILTYFLVIVTVGLYVGKYTKSTEDFFYAGRRYKWWLVSFSCVATLVGSYSFLQYSQVGFQFGFSSLMPYMNEWFILPFFLGLWLPVLYIHKLQSIPEYFEKRFNRQTRFLVLGLLMVYLIGYIGINLLTIGVATKNLIPWEYLFGDSSLGIFLLSPGLIDWQLVLPAAFLAILSGLYLHSGGQTSVLMTDLLQGGLLLLVGLGLFISGIFELGGLGALWEGMTGTHQYPFADFNSDPKLNAVGDFWNDAVIGTFAFYCINQGVLMRFLSVRSVSEGRKSMLFTVAFLMPLAAIAVCCCGWIGKAMVSQGVLPADTDAKSIFMTVSAILTGPGWFGFVIAAVLAALMSTLDTLITAVTAVAVNDIGKLIWKNKSDAYYLKLAKKVALSVTVLAVATIPLFAQFDSIYRALSHFTSMMIPPLVIVMILGVLSKRFSGQSAFWTLLLGTVMMFVSQFFPVLIKPFSHGIPAAGNYSYIRGLYGLIITSVIALVFWLRDRQSRVKISDKHLQWTRYGIQEPCSETTSYNIYQFEISDSLPDGEILINKKLREEWGLKKGDEVLVEHPAWYWGGYRSLRMFIGEGSETQKDMALSHITWEQSSLGKPSSLKLTRL